VFMTRVFSDLHKKGDIYYNSEGEWMFWWNDKSTYIYVNYSRVWKVLAEELGVSGNIVNELIEGWLKENTDWPPRPTTPHLT
jgi:hypothetical protein